MFKIRKNVWCACLLAMALSISCKEIKEADKNVDMVEMEAAKSPEVRFDHDEANKKVAVHINGDLFTNYIYDGQTPKPILYPILTKSGKTVTRGFPYEPRPNERVDHPHHAGHWFNYGDVNGFDFWNNSYAIPEKEKIKFGTIYHQEVLENNAEDGTLEIKAVWRSMAADLVEEITQFKFSEKGDTRTIDRTTTLKALIDISFKDNKEGMVGIRVARELELPTDKPAVYTDADGNVTEVKALNNEGVNGNYFSSSGLQGNDVWGTRNKWVKLEGSIEGETVSITIMDDEKNVGYPTYWHARDYGLFAANPLGQAIFSDGKETLGFELKKGESTTFNYRILIHNGSELSEEFLNQSFVDFNN